MENEASDQMKGEANKSHGDKNARSSKKKIIILPKFACLRTETDEKGNFDMEVDVAGQPHAPSHIVIMVNGIIGNAQNWIFAAKQFLKQYPRDVVVHCSECNSSLLTFDGVDVMGERLAEEVICVIKRHQTVKKISFVSHSLGGLVSRYAIAKLYGKDITGEVSRINGASEIDRCGDEGNQKIAGLEPINFITSATPHLGSRGHRQVPVFCGFYTLEKVAVQTSWFLGKSGKHLFLTDHDEGKAPLLLQMVTDQEDLKFMSALRSFRRRVAYANTRFDYLVGWSSASIRRRSQLPKIKDRTRSAKYPHIAFVETFKNANQEEETKDTKTSGLEDTDMEDEMIRGLTKVSWERVDVHFSGCTQRFLAHNTIQVNNNYWIHSDGVDVIQHMIDNFTL